MRVARRFDRAKVDPTGSARAPAAVGCRRGAALRSFYAPVSQASRYGSGSIEWPLRDRASRRPTSRSAGAAPSHRRSGRPGRAAARRDGLAGADGQRGGLAVREHEVEADAGVLDGVVAGAAGLVAGRGDRAGERRDDRRAFGGQHVLAFVDVAVARRAVAVFGAAEVVRARRPGRPRRRRPSAPASARRLRAPARRGGGAGRCAARRRSASRRQSCAPARAGCGRGGRAR